MKLQIRIEDRRKTTYIFVGWPIADVANDRHPSERGAHCTILQQQWTSICIHTYCTYVFKSRTPFCHLPFLCTIAQLLLQLYFISWFFSGWFCIALLTLKTKWQICKDADADAGSAANAAACRYLLGQLPQSVGNHNKKLILIKRFSCNCCQLRYAPRRIRERDNFASALALTLASLLVFSERGREQRTLECSSSAVWNRERESAISCCAHVTLFR